jgi:hypothetical protein
MPSCNEEDPRPGFSQHLSDVRGQDILLRVAIGGDYGHFVGQSELFKNGQFSLLLQADGWTLGNYICHSERAERVEESKVLSFSTTVMRFLGHVLG